MKGSELTESATVVAVDGESIWVETHRQGTCNSCSANKGCGQGILNRLLPGRVNYVRALCDSKLQRELVVGDRVDISVPEHLVLKSSAMVYLLPLSLLLGGTLVGNGLWQGDAGAILGGSVGLLLGFFVVRLHAYMQRNNTMLQPRVQRAASQQALQPGMLSVHEL